MSKADTLSDPFVDARNITVDGIRIIWRDAHYHYITSKLIPAGWVLPGGESSTDENKVRAYAKELAAVTKENSRKITQVKATI